MLRQLNMVLLPMLGIPESQRRKHKRKIGNKSATDTEV